MDDKKRSEKGYSPLPVREWVVKELVRRYKKDFPEEFQPPKPPRKGFPHPDRNATA